MSEKDEVLTRPRTDAVLKAVLDEFLDESDADTLVAGDPLELVRGFGSPHDQEVAALIVSAVAYGRVASIKQKASALLAMLGPHPSKTIGRKATQKKLSGFVYRFQRGEDLPRFVSAIAALRRRHGSLAATFKRGLNPDDVDYGPALDRFVLDLRAAAGPELTRGLAFLMPRADGQTGAAKRMCLYARWMIRDGATDLGTWQQLEPNVFDRSRLLIPLDTHIERIGRYVGLTDRRTSGMKTAREITEALRRLRPEDPLAYDMVLCHLGIAGHCPRKRDLKKCQGCPIRKICRLGRAPKGW